MIAGLVFGLASLSYLCSVALGVLVATRRLDSSGFRWVHHLLYVVTFVLAAAAAGIALWQRPLAGWLLLPALVVFALIPLLGTRGMRHPVAGLAPVPFYLAAAVALLA